MSSRHTKNYKAVVPGTWSGTVADWQVSWLWKCSVVHTVHSSNDSVGKLCCQLFTLPFLLAAHIAHGFEYIWHKTTDDAVYAEPLTVTMATKLEW